MQAGNGNNTWREKLDELTAPPEGFTFRAEATWQTLEARLTSSKKKKRFAGIYAAACAVLFLIVFIVYNKQPKDSTKINGIPMARKIIGNTAPVKKDEKLLPPSATVPVVNSKKRAIINAEKKSVAIQNYTFIQPATLEDRTIEITTQVPQPEDKTTLISVSAYAQKPKFKTAHINELTNQKVELPPLQPAKTNTVFLFQRTNSSAVYYEPAADENIVAKKKGRTLFSLLNSSQ
jgi:hypothetical protein